MAWQGLCRAAVWFAEGDIWGRRGSVSGKQNRERQSHSTRLDKPSSSGLGNLSCKRVHVHRAALGVASTKTWTGSDLTHLLPHPRSDRGLGKQHIAHITLPVVCSLPVQAFLLWGSPVAASIQEQYCESLPPVTNHTGECPASPAHRRHPQGTLLAGMAGRGGRGCLRADLQLPSSFLGGGGMC